MAAKGYGITTADMVSAIRHSLQPITTVCRTAEADLHPCWLRRRHHGWFLCRLRTQSRAGDPAGLLYCCCCLLKHRMALSRKELLQPRAQCGRNAIGK